MKKLWGKKEEAILWKPGKKVRGEAFLANTSINTKKKKERRGADVVAHWPLLAGRGTASRDAAWAHVEFIGISK